MKNLILITLLFLFAAIGAKAQHLLEKTMNEIENLYKKKNNTEEILSYYNKTINKINNENDIFKITKEIASFFEKNKKIKEAIWYYEKSLNYTNKFKEEIEIDANLSTSYEWIKEAKKALFHADEVLKKSEDNKYYHAPSTLKVLIVKAKFSQRENDVNKAIIYYEKAKKIAISEFGYKSIDVAEINTKIGSCYDLSGDYKKALSIKENALKIARGIPNLPHTKLSGFYRSIGLTYQKKEDYFKAIDIYTQAITVLKRNDTVQVGRIYEVIGNCYYYLEESEKAVKYFLSAIRMFNDVKDGFKVSIFENLTKAGACYTNLGRYQEASTLIDSALVMVGFDKRKSLPFEQISCSKPSLLITLYFKAKNSLQQYLKNGCEEDLERAHQEYDVCIRLIDHIISSFDDSDSKQYLVDRFYYVFESIIEVNYQFFLLRGERKYVDRAMRYMEKSRSILLKEMMQHAKASLAGGIPDTILAHERRLREQIAALENRKYESERKSPFQNDIAGHQLNDSLFALREQYWALLKQMEQRYPSYYDLKHADRSPETAAIVNNLLLPQEALVQYFVGDDHLYTLVYRGDGAFTMTKTPVGSLDQDIKALRESIYGYVLTPTDSLVQAYADGAYRLYEKLLQPISGYLPYRVMVIPDGLLEYLPFEALLTKKADLNSSFRTWPYCLRKYSFSYAHSVLSLEEMRQRENHPKYRKVLAIAPAFSPILTLNSAEERRRSFGVLEDNLAEVTGIGDLFPAKTLVGAEATVESFKALAGDYAVLHLATHAKADNENGEYAYVAFSETKDTTSSNLLYLRNLYTLALHADMVALSACETGVGKLRRGEGVVSLARGFSYAGANSLVTTLWRISDRESSTLMQRYYLELKEGLSKDEALRRAKLDYLDQASGNRAHPFFWAAFVTIGDMAPLDLQDWSWMWWMAAGLLALGWLLGRKLQTRWRKFPI